MAQQDLGDLGGIIARPEARGRLVRVTSEVDPVHDLAGVAFRLEGPVLCHACWRGSVDPIFAELAY